MSDPDSALAWADYAEEDLIVAKSTLRRKQPLTSASCFHSQQCAEKYFKAILVAKDVQFPKTHDLAILNTLCTNAGIFTGFPIDSLGRLSGYAVHTRYPGSQPTPDEAQDALEIALTIRQFARKFLGLKR
jgi:HEPN domain-containing protein